MASKVNQQKMYLQKGMKIYNINKTKSKKFLWCRKSKMLADAVLEKEYVLRIPEFGAFTDGLARKDKQAAQVFGGAFSWVLFFDAAADVYHGVCLFMRLGKWTNAVIVCLLVDSDFPWSSCLV